MNNKYVWALVGVAAGYYFANKIAAVLPIKPMA